MQPNQQKEPRRIRFWLVLLLVNLLLVEIISFVSLKALKNFNIGYWPILKDDLYPIDKKVIKDTFDSTDTYVVHDPGLGWSIRPNGVSQDKLYRANAEGIRGDQSYSLKKPKDKVRVLAFGDSFTHGDEVNNDQMWTRRLELKNKKLQVINFGVGGYSLDQSYLRYQKSGTTYQSDIVLIGFMSENINRLVNILRAFYTPLSGLPLSKPRYKITANGNLQLVENPLDSRDSYDKLLTNPNEWIPALGEHDYWYEAFPHKGAIDFLSTVKLLKTARFWFNRSLSPHSIIQSDGVYRPDTEALKIAQKLSKMFYQSVLTRRAKPIIVLFPTHRDINRFKTKGKKRYQPLIDYLRQEGLVYVDLLDYLGTVDIEVKNILGHYTPSTNQLVAEAIYQFLLENRLI